MATIATINLASNISAGFGGITKTMTLRKAGTTNDITETTGFSRRKLAATTAVDLITMANELVEPLDNTAAKVYIKNMNLRGDGTKYVTVLLLTREIGRLYGGDWMFFPWNATDGKDIEITPSDATETTLEYTIFYE